MPTRKRCSYVRTCAAVARGFSGRYSERTSLGESVFVIGKGVIKSGLGEPMYNHAATIPRLRRHAVTPSSRVSAFLCAGPLGRRLRLFSGCPRTEAEAIAIL